MMPERPEPAFLRPRGLPLRLFASAGFGAWFWIVYFGCDLLAQNFRHRFDVHLAIDGWLPFAPSFALAYLAITPLLGLPILALRDTLDVLALYATLAAETTLAGAVFLLFPVEPSAAPPGVESFWLAAADLVNLTYNGLPSLHVALAVSVGMGASRDLCPLPRMALWALVVLIAVSTLLTKQHYVADAVSGAVLAVLSMLFIRPALRRLIGPKMQTGAA